MKKILLFLAITAGLCIPWWILARGPGGYGYITALMWSPALAALLTIKLTGGSLSELGWNGASLKWVAAAWLAAVAYSLLAYGPVFLLHRVQLGDAATLQAAIKPTGLEDAHSPLTFFVLGVIVITAGAIRLSGPALGEELGWRGFLSPHLIERFGFPVGALVTGLIWSAFHYPLMLGRVPAWQILNFTVAITGLSFAYSWFRLRSESVWPCVVMHGVHNAVGELYFLKLVAPGPDADRWLDETGIAMPVVGVLVAGLALLAAHRRWFATVE